MSHLSTAKVSKKRDSILKTAERDSASRRLSSSVHGELRDMISRKRMHARRCFSANERNNVRRLCSGELNHALSPNHVVEQWIVYLLFN